MKKKDKQSSLCRTYKFSSKEVNEGKLSSIIDLSIQYKKYYNCLMRASLPLLYSDSKLPKFLPQLNQTELSERYKQNCGKHVKSDIDSLLSNTSNKIRNYISKSSLSSEEKSVLYYINSCKLWFVKELKIKENEVPSYLLHLSRILYKRVRSKTPKMRNVTMRLDNRVADVQDSELCTFNKWIKLSTLKKGKPIYLPFNLYDYFKDKKGQLKNEVQIEVKYNKFSKTSVINFNLIKELEQAEKTNTDKVIGIDLGIVNLLSSSSGNTYGKTLYKKLLHYDSIIQSYTKKLRANGIKTSTPKLDRLHRKVRSLIKNEVGRCLNVLIKKENPDIVVIENLTDISRKSKLSRKMNRILSNSGLNKVPNRLKDKCVVLNKTVVEVNPAFTSTECPICHNVNKNNRKTQNKFECLNCGYTKNADYNAAVNIRNRRSISEINIYTSYKSVPGLLSKFYLNNRSLSKPKYRLASAKIT